MHTYVIKFGHFLLLMCFIDLIIKSICGTLREISTHDLPNSHMTKKKKKGGEENKHPHYQLIFL